MRRFAALALTLLAGACAPEPEAAAPAPAMNPHKIIVRIKSSTSNVKANTEQPTEREGAGNIWIENKSTDTVAILSLTLHDCHNIRQQCDVPIPMKTKLAPNERRQVLRVLRNVSGSASSMTYTYEFSGDGAIRRGLSSLEVQLRPSDILKLGDKIAFLKADPDSVVLVRGDVLVASQLHIVALGAQREMLGEFRGSFDFHVQEGTVNLIPPDTLIGIGPGRRVLTVSAGNPGNVRKLPFEPLKINLIVK